MTSFLIYTSIFILIKPGIKEKRDQNQFGVKFLPAVLVVLVLAAFVEQIVYVITGEYHNGQDK